MKRRGYIFEKICDIDNLREAHRNSRKDKTYYREVKMVDSDPDFYLKKIQEMLANKTYKVSEYTISTLNDKGKERELMKLPYFPDRIIQWAIMLQIEQDFMNVFCNHSCASVKGRGIHHATRLVDKYMKDKEGCKYCLKIDIKKFYPNIDHEILKQLLRKIFKDKNLLWILDLIIDSMPEGKGVPIGSYLSQYLANFYLTYFDHWLKEEKRVKYVIRYMDDIVIFGATKEELHQLKSDIDNYLEENLKLKIKGNHQVFPTAIRGVDFVGYRHFFGYKLLRKSTCKRFKRTCRRIYKRVKNGALMRLNEFCSINSYDGWLKWCNSWRLKEKYIKQLEEALLKYREVYCNA